jgi:hypothetical protein
MPTLYFTRDCGSFDRQTPCLRAVTVSKTDLSLLLSVLSVLLSLGLTTYAVVAAMAYLLAKVT